MLFQSPDTEAPLSLTTVVPITTKAAADYIGFSITPTNGTIYYGDSTTTTSNGLPLASGQTLTVATKNPASWYVVAASGTVDVRVALHRGSR